MRAHREKALSEWSLIGHFALSLAACLPAAQKSRAFAPWAQQVAAAASSSIRPANFALLLIISLIEAASAASEAKRKADAAAAAANLATLNRR